MSPINTALRTEDQWLQRAVSQGLISEAELIAARRAAGIYGPKSHPWKIRIVAIAAGLLCVVALILLTH